MVTIKDIARESGYSISTVSRVLNHRSDVSPDAKKKIEEVVAKFNFVPNNNAKHLKQNNSKTIGVLVKGISNMLFASIVEEIQQLIEKTEYTVTVSYLDEDADEVEQAILLCRERKPLGLLFLGGNPEYFEKHGKRIKKGKFPYTNKIWKKNMKKENTRKEKNSLRLDCEISAVNRRTVSINNLKHEVSCTTTSFSLCLSL